MLIRLLLRCRPTAEAGNAHYESLYQGEAIMTATNVAAKSSQRRELRVLPSGAVLGIQCFPCFSSHAVDF